MVALAAPWERRRQQTAASGHGGDRGHDAHPGQPS